MTRNKLTTAGERTHVGFGHALPTGKPEQATAVQRMHAELLARGFTMIAALESGHHYSKGGYKRIGVVLSDDAYINVSAYEGNLTEWQIRNVNIETVPVDVFMGIIRNAENSL